MVAAAPGVRARQRRPATIGRRGRDLFTATRLRDRRRLVVALCLGSRPSNLHVARVAGTLAPTAVRLASDSAAWSSAMRAIARTERLPPAAECDAAVRRARCRLDRGVPVRHGDDELVISWHFAQIPAYFRDVLAGNVAPWPLSAAAVVALFARSVRDPRYRLLRSPSRSGCRSSIVVARRDFALRDLLPMVYLVYLVAAVIVIDLCCG